MNSLIWYCIYSSHTHTHTHTHVQQKVFILNHPNALKALSPGRVVTVYTSAYHHSLAVILQQHSGSNRSPTSKSFTVLMLCNSEDDSEEKAKSIADSTSSSGKVSPYRPVGGLFMPHGEVKHAVVTLEGQLISNITEESLSVEPKKIIDDYSRRQIPRFRQAAAYIQ